MDKTLLFSVVVPVYNSEDSVSKVVDETHRVFTEWDMRYEIILVNDGSQDKSWDIVSDLAKKHPNVSAINFLKNYGQHNALLCGFKHSKGDYVITIDDDLQNPHSEIIKLIKKGLEGYDLVMGEFIQKKHSLHRRLGSRLVHHLNRKIFNFEPSLILSNFRLIHKDVIKRVISYKTSFPYIPGLVLMFSGKRANVLVEHHQRTHGVSNYNIFTILKLVSRILFNYSSYPLRAVGMIGAVVAAGSFLFALFHLLNAFFFGSAVPGWATLTVMFSFLNGVVLLMLSMIGEYLVRLVNQTSSSQAYYVTDICSAEEDAKEKNG